MTMAEGAHVGRVVTSGAGSRELCGAKLREQLSGELARSHTRVALEGAPAT